MCYSCYSDYNVMNFTGRTRFPINVLELPLSSAQVPVLAASCPTALLRNQSIYSLYHLSAHGSIAGHPLPLQGSHVTGSTFVLNDCSVSHGESKKLDRQGPGFVKKMSRVHFHDESKKWPSLLLGEESTRLQKGGQREIKKWLLA